MKIDTTEETKRASFVFSNGDKEQHDEEGSDG